MARKIKITPKKKDRNLFDLTGDLFATPMPELPPVNPADFSVDAPTARTPERKAGAMMEIDPADIVVADTVNFISFGSGSSGNCSFIGDATGGVLIDAGVDIDTVRDMLRRHGIGMDAIKGVCLTHDHSDHVRYVYSLVRKNPHIGVYCTPKTLSGILRRHSISRRIKDYHRPIYKEFPFNLAGFELTAFEVSHDGADNSGYFIRRGEHTFAIATDLGEITPRVDYYMRQARYVMIEANYDATMLQHGPYPLYLQARISSATGHLDNMVTRQFIRDIYSDRLTHVFLCHLSHDNNTPDKALEAVRGGLLEAGAAGVGDGTLSVESRACAVQLVALPRYDASPLYVLRVK